MVLVFSSMLLAGIALLLYSVVAATRVDHLMFLYWGGSELFVFVRRSRVRRYDRIHLWQVPGAALRFSTDRLLSRVQRPKPVLAPVPVPVQTRREARFARLAH
jgi:hypothetical protein